MKPFTLFIAVCTNRPLHPLWVSQLTSVCREAEKYFNEVTLFFSQVSVLPAARQQSVDAFLSSGHSHILFWDDDVIPPARGLLNLLLDGEPIVAGHYMMRRPPFNSLLEVLQDKDDKDPPPNPRLVPAKIVPLGFTLIERQVFLDIRPPHFMMTPAMEEDSYFSRRARKAGYKLYFDKEVECLHLGEALYGTKEIPLALIAGWGLPPIINPRDIQRRDDH